MHKLNIQKCPAYIHTRVYIYLCPTLGQETRWIIGMTFVVDAACALQPVEIRSRGGAPPVDGGAKGHINSDTI
jgi:hypothetical protein